MSSRVATLMTTYSDTAPHSAFKARLGKEVRDDVVSTEITTVKRSIEETCFAQSVRERGSFQPPLVSLASR